MKQEKLTSAVASAMGYLKDSVKLMSKGNDEDVSDLVWRAAADLEYALFLFSIMNQNGSQSSSWKLGLSSKEVEVESILASARDLLEEGESKIEAGELREAHKEVWMARGYLLKLQEFFEKRRRLEKAAKKSS